MAENLTREDRRKIALEAAAAIVRIDAIALPGGHAEHFEKVRDLVVDAVEACQPTRSAEVPVPDAAIIGDLGKTPADLRGQRDVLAALLFDAVEPLELSSALVETEEAATATEQLIKRIRAALSALSQGAVVPAHLVLEMAMEWWSERPIKDWAEADLAKAVAAYLGDWEGCSDCDHQRDEPCMPATVAETHSAIDHHIADLVHAKLLHAPTDYQPPEGWKASDARTRELQPKARYVPLRLPTPAPAAAVAALRELVDLQDMKVAMAKIAAAPGFLDSPASMAKHDWLSSSYANRRAGAWDAARAALAAPAAPQPAAQAAPAVPDREETIKRIFSKCQQVPGSNQWNAAEWMYDEMAAALTDQGAGHDGLRR